MQSSKMVSFLASIIVAVSIAFCSVIGLETIRRLWIVVRGLRSWVIILIFVVLAGIMGLFYDKNNEAKKEKDFME